VQHECWQILSCTWVNIADTPIQYKTSITGHQWVLSDGQVHLSVNPSGDAKKLIRTEADDSGLELCSGQQICNGRLDA